MIEELYKKPSENLAASSVCEICGVIFTCGAKNGNCWCFDVKLSPHTLAELNKNHTACLCPACLKNLENENIVQI